MINEINALPVDISFLFQKCRADYRIYPLRRNEINDYWVSSLPHRLSPFCAAKRLHENAYRKEQLQRKDSRKK